MQQQTFLHIPQPCHEDWHTMTPEGKGRFCASCSKQVVDFSLMTDPEIISYFSQTSGKTCGRFAGDQLQRPLVTLKQERKKTWWMAMLLPLLLFFEKSNAQKRKTAGKQATPAITRCEPKQQIMGKVAMPILPLTSSVMQVDTAIPQSVPRIKGDTVLHVTKMSPLTTVTIKGKLTDADNHQPIAFASVAIKDRSHGTLCDADGLFSLTIPVTKENINLVFSSVGYESKQISSDSSWFEQAGNESTGIIQLNEQLTGMNSMISGDVVVVGYTIKHKAAVKKDTIATSVRKVFRSEIFKPYPNPVSRGSVLNIQFRKAGTYSIQVLDNSSRLAAVQHFNAADNAAVTTIALPAASAAGVYYIVVTDERKKKQYSEKIIVR